MIENCEFDEDKFRRLTEEEVLDLPLEEFNHWQNWRMFDLIRSYSGVARVRRQVQARYTLLAMSKRYRAKHKEIADKVRTAI